MASLTRSSPPRRRWPEGRKIDGFATVRIGASWAGKRRKKEAWRGLGARPPEPRTGPDERAPAVGRPSLGPTQDRAPPPTTARERDGRRPSYPRASGGPKK